jgi:molecular chaperone GrpE (heat shock protein)
MSEQIQFDDPFYPIPPAAMDADPAAVMRDLFFRVGRLEQSLAEEREQAVAEARTLLLGLLSLSDEITATIERYGIATSAQEAAVIRNVVAFGRRLLTLLRQERVLPIEPLGKPRDPETSDVAGQEAQAGAADGVVLREVQIGYSWPHGILAPRPGDRLPERPR